MAADRALVLSDAHWRWVVREVPPQILDTYRIEGLYRTTAPGTALILGNSTAEEGFDTAVLEDEFADRGLRFAKLTLGGSSLVSFGLLSEQIAAIDPPLVILMATAGSARGRDYQDSVYMYDIRSALQLFTSQEVWQSPDLHLRGLLRQSHVFARNRHAMQRSLAVALGWEHWWRMRLGIQQYQLRLMLAGVPVRRFQKRMTRKALYPNPNTRSITRLARQARVRGGSFILVEAPVHPMMKGYTGDRRQAEFREVAERRAQRDDFPFVTANEFPPFDESDFKDLIHLGSSGRDRFTARFAEILREIL